MKRLFITLFVLTLLTGKGWSEDSKEILAEESNTAWFDSILSWLENSDMTSLKKYCEGDSRKMIDVLYYYVPYLNKPPKKVWYNEYKCERSFIGVPTKYEDAIKCASYKLKAYFWMILINNGLMEDDGKYICVFYEGEKAIYDKSFYYDYKSSSFVYENCDNRELDEKFRKWYEALKDNDREKAQAEIQKISYRMELDKCREKRERYNYREN